MAGSPLAGLGLVVGQVLAGHLTGGLVGLLLVAAYLLEGRNATLPLTLVASRTFIVRTWLLCLALLWLVTLAVTPQPSEVVTSSVSVTLSAVATFAISRWKAVSFWPSRTDGNVDRLVSHLRGTFAAIDRLAA